MEKVGLNEKVSYSKKLIKKALKSSINPTVSWSGGKDSTVILHLILRIAPKVPTIFVELDCLFPETRKFIFNVAEHWKLNLIVAKSEDHTFNSIGQKYGYPIFSKNIASNVERAVRTGNIRSQLSQFESIACTKQSQNIDQMQ